MKKSLLSQFSQRPDYDGYGLIGHICREKNQNIDKIFDYVVKDLKITKKQAFLFANSRCGRFTGDSLENLKSESKIKETLKKDIKRDLPDLEKEAL